MHIDGIFWLLMKRTHETAQIIADDVCRTPERRSKAWPYPELSNDQISPLFQSAIESTEEAIYNSLCMAQTITGTGGVPISAMPFSVVENKNFETQQGEI
jgi:L-aminopeptidase/D-esterase-like protein